PRPRILQIEAYHLIKSRPAPPFDLPKPGNAWLDFQHPAAMPQIVGLVFVRYRGSRSNQGHFTGQDIPELRKLIQTGLAEEFPDRRNPRVFLNFKHRFVAIRTRAIYL